MFDEIKSGKEYAEVLIESVLEIENTLPDEEKMDKDFFQIWCDVINEKCEQSWVEYLTGKKEDFYFTEDEFTKTFNEAKEKIISETVSSLLEKDMINMSINNNGEILYALTENGVDELKKMNIK